MSRLITEFIQVIEQQDSRVEHIDDALLTKYLQYELKFGKYKGFTYQQILKKDYSYFKWVVAKQEEHSPKTHQILTYLIHQIEQQLVHKRETVPHACPKHVTPQKITHDIELPKKESKRNKKTPHKHERYILEKVSKKNSSARRKMDQIIPKYNHGIASEADTSERLAQSYTEERPLPLERKKRRLTSSSSKNAPEMAPSTPASHLSGGEE